MASKAAAADPSRISRAPLALLAVAWLIPGGGHLWQRRWGRGALLLLSVSGMFLMGVAMGGRLFRLTPSNIVETLGFVGDLGSGLLLMAARFWGYGPVESASPFADYGTKFLLVAGLLNVLCILDAYDIAVGKKS